LFVPTLTPVVSPTPPPVNNVGIVSGHRGLHPSTGLPDPGAVCEDGLTEQEVVGNVAIQVAELLRGHGYQVDVFDEFDPRLQGYRALAMVSIHADSCEFINELATGFKVASFSASSAPEEDARLVGCLITRYEETTGMAFHPSVTFDMTEYHNFSEVAPGTPGAIIEIGFMYLDRPILTDHADVVALGAARGVLCYLRGEPTGVEDTPGPETTPIETPTPEVTPTRVP
jgi:N-acetylmuramoyl-L-alanine amidase